MSGLAYHTITVVGCGAMGSLVAGGLLRAGHRVTVIEHRQRLEQIREHGIEVCTRSGENYRVRPQLATDSFDLPPQDLVFLALKAHSIPPVAMSIAGLLHDNSAVVTLQNGVPWWYFLGVDGYNRDRVIHSVDPNGTLTSSIPACKLVGCVAYPAATVLHNGVVRHVEGERFPLGELDGTVSERVRVLGALLQSAGFKAPALADLRGEIWLKLWGAAVFNPLSMLTRATMVDIATNEHTRALVIRMMREVEAVATALGVSMRVPLQQRLAGAERVGEHKTSALQDLERGEPGELAALLGAVIELGGISGVDTPTLQAVYASCALLERVVVGELASAVAADTAFC